jgi:hypothetical protein
MKADASTRSIWGVEFTVAITGGDVFESGLKLAVEA